MRDKAVLSALGKCRESAHFRSGICFVRGRAGEEKRESVVMFDFCPVSPRKWRLTAGGNSWLRSLNYRFSPGTKKKSPLGPDSSLLFLSLAFFLLTLSQSIFRVCLHVYTVGAMKHCQSSPHMTVLLSEWCIQGRKSSADVQNWCCTVHSCVFHHSYAHI